MQISRNTAAELARVDAALQANAVVSLDMALAFVERHPDNIDGLILLARAHQVRAQFREMLGVAERAVALDPRNVLCRASLMEAMYHCGRSAVALDMAARLEQEAKFDPVALDRIGNFYALTNRYADATRLYERLHILQPTNPFVVQRLGASYSATGEIEKAEKLFSNLIRRSPDRYFAYYSRASLRKQTLEDNHLAELERVLAGPFDGSASEYIVWYALAKELEDLGEWKRSFGALKRGADAKRRQSPNYRVESDLGIIDTIISEFGEAFFRRAPKGYEKPAPFFVIGMPRSGTTLVDRILSSHSGIGSVGESDNFTVTLARHIGGQRGDGKIAYDGTSALDFETIGREYHGAVEDLLPGYAHILDKTPPNYCNAGAIVAALPRAKIICLRRNPMASCYAIYKTPFRAGYAFSYDLEELGRYYLGFLKLMEHWRRVLPPGHMLEVDYEDIVRNQERVSREMISFCGLEWEEGCLDFEKNAAPSLTASVAQIRQPIYSSSIELWRNYEEELEPLARFFRANGVAID